MHETILKLYCEKGIVSAYYYQGNFFYPLNIEGVVANKVKLAIMEWKRQNMQKLVDDRSNPCYRSLTDLFDEQMTKGE